MRPDVETGVDAGKRTATITTTFEQPPEVVWTLWSDPAKLARWWGPPGLPMTVDHHDLRAGGRVEVTVHAADSVIRGRWSISAVDPRRSLRFTFASDGLEPTDVDVRLEPVAETTTTMTITARFASDAHLGHAIEIGLAEGIARACASAHAVL